MIWHLIDKNRKMLKSRKAYRIFFNEIHQSVYISVSRNLFKELNKLQYYIYKSFDIFNVI